MAHYQNTPLHEAILKQDFEQVQKLLNSGADIDERNTHGDTPLAVSLITRSCCDIIKLLIEKGADVNMKNDSGKAPMHNVLDLKVSNKYRPIIICRHLNIWKLDVLYLLLKAGADINVKDLNGSTPLHMAVQADCLQTVEILLYYNADATVINNLGETAFMLALRLHSTLKIVELLIEYEVDFNLVNESQESTLKLALGYSFDLSHEVISRGANVLSVGTIGISIPTHPLSQRPADELFKRVSDTIDLNKTPSRAFAALLDFTLTSLGGENLIYLIEKDYLKEYNEHIDDIHLFLLLILSRMWPDPKGIDFVYHFLSYGYHPIDDEVYYIYCNYKECYLFRALIEMDIPSSITMAEVLHPTIILNITKSAQLQIERYLLYYDPDYVIRNINTLMYFCTNQKLRNLFKQIIESDKLEVAEPLIRMLDREVPSLVELSRDKFREYACQEFHTQNSHQLYRFLNRLNVPPAITRIILFIEPIYFS